MPYGYPYDNGKFSQNSKNSTLKLVSKPIPPKFSFTFVCILIYKVCRFAANFRGKDPVFTHPEVILKKMSMSHWVAY